NKELDLKWEHFVSKLQPNQKETWTLVVTKPGNGAQGNGANGKSTAPERWTAEMVATLYDESLDAFAPHHWMQRFGVFRQDMSTLQAQFANRTEMFRFVLGGWNYPHETVEIRYRSFPPDLTANVWGYGWGMGGRARYARGVAKPEAMAADSSAAYMLAAPAPQPATVALGRVTALKDSVGGLAGAHEERVADQASAPSPKVDLGQVTARKNLNETAFFYPQLTTDSNGAVRLTFTMPEALTKWRFMGFAHDRSVRSGYLEGHTVTAKDLMVQPNPPRFLREGDTVEFTVKVSNQSDQPQTGLVRLTFNNAFTGQSADQLLNIQPATTGSTTTRSQRNRGSNSSRNEQSFTIPAKESRSFAWRITVPDGCGFLTYKAVGAAAKVSDGEEGAVPVLSRRILVTESLPLPIRGPATKKFEFTRLLKSGNSKSLQHQSLTVQMVSNPAWYAVLALPYLMEFPYECTEQTFNRFYANALARNIANGDPKIRRVFDQWKNTPALDSPLENNEDLKSVALEETPWLRQAQAESQARRNVGILFDDNRLNYETERTLQKLAEMQLADGAWPWFPGGPANDYITLYITTGFGRLRHLGVDVNVAPAIRSLQRLDGWMTKRYDEIQKWPEPEKYVPSSLDALYLYGRSFFLKDQAIAPAHKKAVDFFLAQSRKFWLQTNWRQTQGQLALALKRFNAFGGFGPANDPTPMAIMNSIKERSVTNEEMGMFWRDTELSWWWYRAPIETQALMIEAFDEVAKDQKSVEDCRVWLLKQKQTQDWKTTKATADAVYALLLRGRDILSSDALVELKLDGIDLTPKVNQGKGSQAPSKQSAKAPTNATPEAGTGFYEVRFAPAEIKPSLGRITVKKVDQGVAWGSVHWQYLEDMSKVTPYAGTPLKLKKNLFVKNATNRGLVLEPLKGPVQVGDELVVRIELRVDRDMEYVHLKDQRGSGTEPVNVLSHYKYQDGLAYYESTRDAAS
ncbi:MAG TPA: alpha-2-macroglobulin family protein, partial [Clostridia bacterium]|nr:alpha-2-macroglobulin family protein [Clostridia bacterium]